MKINLSKDLAPVRERALARLDGFLAQSRPLDAIHARKLAEARQVEPSASTAPLLTAEASLRGVSFAELAAMVLAKAAVAEAALLARELDRQARQARIRDAANPAEIDAALSGLEPQ